MTLSSGRIVAVVIAVLALTSAVVPLIRWWLSPVERVVNYVSGRPAFRETRCRWKPKEVLTREEWWPIGKRSYWDASVLQQWHWDGVLVGLHDSDGNGVLTSYDLLHTRIVSQEVRVAGDRVLVRKEPPWLCAEQIQYVFDHKRVWPAGAFGLGCSCARPDPLESPFDFLDYNVVAELDGPVPECDGSMVVPWGGAY